MTPAEDIAQVLRENAKELTEIDGNPLLSEWVVLALYVDEDGGALLVCQPSESQLRSHTLGLLEMAREEV